MIRAFIFLLSVSFFVLSCDKAQDTKGESIPPAQMFQKAQKPEIIVAYLSKLLENEDGANLHYLRAKAYLEMRAYSKAGEDIQQALKKIPSDVDYLLLSAQIKGHLGLVNEAIEDAKLVESSGLSSSKLYLVLAGLHFANHEKRLGNSYLLKVQKAGVPQSEKAYFRHLARQFRADSLGALQSISIPDCAHPDLAHAYYFYQIGRLPNIQYQKQVLAELKKYPMDPYLMLAWGNFLVHVNQFSQADKVYNQVGLWLPQNPSVRLQLVRFYIDRKRYDLANKQLDQVGTSTFEFRDAVYLRALLQLNAGQKSQSISLLDSVRKIYKSDSRFTLLYDRLVGRKIDSSISVKDSTQEMEP